MAKLYEETVLLKYLEKFGNGKIDLSSKATQKFMEQYAGSILMLVPDGAALLVNNGLPDDPTVVFLAMAALGATLKEIGETKVSELQGEYNEKDNEPNVVDFTRKLRNVH